MSTEIKKIPQNADEMRAMSDDDLRYLLQRDKVPAKAIREFGEDEARALVDGEGQLPQPRDLRREPIPNPAGSGEVEEPSDVDPLLAVKNSRLRAAITERAEARNETPDLGGRKEDLVARLNADREAYPDQSDSLAEEMADEEDEDDSTEGQ